VKGDTGAAGPAGTAVQRIRVQTDINGRYVWTFPTPYPAGVVPVIGLTVQDATAGNVVFNHKLLAVTNTSVTIQLAKVTTISVAGVGVLGFDTNPQAFVHITAVAP
jgi:hypothetical protein